MDDYKEVYFDEYCGTCEYRDMKDTDEPCNECLENPMNLHSHKPVKYKRQEPKPKKSKKD